MSIIVPPIKIQGIKTKLLPFILENMNWDGEGTYIEPFLGSGCVLFNLAPNKALVNDANPHIINFYQGIQRGNITYDNVKSYLLREGMKLNNEGGDHYYRVRERFNNHHNPLDFLFLSRSCFNGLIRFNMSGKFNTPFCKKPNRFNKAYITRISNQVLNVSNLIRKNNWEFVCADYKSILDRVTEDDFVYADPPYSGRFTTYYTNWTNENRDFLEQALKELPCPFLYSMWAETPNRYNHHLYECFSDYEIKTSSHTYYVGTNPNPKGNPVTEGLVIGDKISVV